VDYAISSDISLKYDALNRLTNMVDGVGTNRYTYDAAGQLLSEDGPWSDDTVNYTNQNRLRTGLSVLAPNASAWSQTYAYDAAIRLTNVTSRAGKFGYSYKAGQASSVLRILFPAGSYVTNQFDSEARLLATTLKNSGNTTLNQHQYSYNISNQRTQQVFTAGNYVNYAYDSIGQLKTANGVEPAGGTNRLHEQFGYAYDAAGNLNFRTNNALTQSFNVDSLNALKTISRSGTLTVAGTTTSQATNVMVNMSNAILYVDSIFVSTNHSLADGNNTFTAVAKDSLGRQGTSSVAVNLPATNMFAYDLNGNMLTNGTLYLEYDDENQLIRITEPGSWRSEFSYDGKMRRRIRREYTWSSSWAQTNEVRYVYDGNLVIQERDENNLPRVSYTRGKDLSGSCEGAGGIGGLLARTDHSTFSPQSTSCYHADGNGNITALINSNQIVVARYEYDPFGTALSISGPLADANLYRFSSKELHANSGFIYYLYRVYNPNLQRWVNRDPIGLGGGINLFAFIGNSPIHSVDLWGKKLWRCTTRTPILLGIGRHGYLWNDDPSVPAGSRECGQGRSSGSPGPTSGDHLGPVRGSPDYTFGDYGGWTGNLADGRQVECLPVEDTDNDIANAIYMGLCKEYINDYIWLPLPGVDCNSNLRYTLDGLGLKPPPFRRFNSELPFGLPRLDHNPPYSGGRQNLPPGKVGG
jgi:RHS repeat-associated protein